MKKVAPWAGDPLTLYTSCDYHIIFHGKVGDSVDLTFLDFLQKAEGKQIEWCELPQQESRLVFMRVV